MILPTIKQQQAILAMSQMKYILLTGGVRSGKTYSVLEAMPLLVKMHREENCMLGAKTLANVERNLLDELRKIYPGMVGNIEKKNGEINVNIFGKKFWIITFNDESSKNRLQGTSIGLAILDEIALCPQSFYEMLKTRLDKPFSQLIGTCNPEGPNHYIKTLLNHENVYTGVKYKDDPTIFSWELANEPRCESDAGCENHVVENFLCKFFCNNFSIVKIAQWSIGASLSISFVFFTTYKIAFFAACNHFIWLSTSYKFNNPKAASLV